MFEGRPRSRCGAFLLLAAVVLWMASGGRVGVRQSPTVDVAPRVEFDPSRHPSASMDVACTPNALVYSISTVSIPKLDNRALRMRPAGR